METGSSRESTARVVVLRDSRWPDLPGVCCWRAAVDEAFAVAGAAVTEATWQGPRPAVKTDGAVAPVKTPKLPWLPSPVRRPMVASYRLARQAASRLRSTPKPSVTPIPGTEGAQIVLAESMPAARAAIRRGAPADRVWALSLPPARTIQGAGSAYTALVEELASSVAGFVADSEVGRDAIERAAATSRPRVVVLPPLAVDRVCTTCGKAETPLEPFVDDGSLDKETVAAVSQLSAWRLEIERGRAGDASPVPYSFPMARLRGFSAAWSPALWLDWTQDDATSPRVGIPDAAPDWSIAAQERGARAVLDATLPRVPATPRAKRDVMISGYDLKFIRELGGRLDNRTDLDVALDEWPAISQRSEETAALAASVDTIVAEWARPTAAWLAEQKKPGQYVVVRLHRFELESGYPQKIDIDKVDAVVYIAPPIGLRIRDEIGWPKEKLVYIPNFLDIDWFERPKLPDARFAIGMVGIDWQNKRFDLALDVLAAVRREDPRFTLHVRSASPWDNKYVWAKPEEQEYIGWCQERIERDPLLRGAVTLEGSGRDMARWYRRVGNILSMSDIEGVHLSAAEGMASGAVPVFRPWSGVRDVYDDRWIHSSVDRAAAAVLENADPEVWVARSVAAQAEMRRKADPSAVINAWADLLHGQLDSAREYFADYARI